MESPRVRVADGDWVGVRAITVRQPWCEAIADGVKLVENRSSGFPKAYRGLLLLHAGHTWSARGAHDPRIIGWRADRWGLRLDGEAMPIDFDRAAVLAVAHLVDVHPSGGCCKPWGEDDYPPANPERRTPGQVTHLVLEDVVRLVVPVPAKGALGLWKPHRDLVEAVRAQVPA